MLHRQLWRQRNIILLILGFVIYLNLFHEDLQKKSSEKRSLDDEEIEGVELEDFINTNSKKLDEEGLRRIISSLQQRLKTIDSSFVTSPDFENLQDLQTSPVSSTSSTSSTTSSSTDSSPSSTVSISTSSTNNKNSVTSIDATITTSPSSTSSRKELFSVMIECRFYRVNQLERNYNNFNVNNCNTVAQVQVPQAQHQGQSQYLQKEVKFPI